MKILIDQNIIEQIKKNLDCPITKRPNVDFNLNNAQKTLCDQFGSFNFIRFWIGPIHFGKSSGRH